MSDEVTWYRAISGSDRIQSLTGTLSSTGNSVRSRHSIARKVDGWHESRASVRLEQVRLARKRLAMYRRRIGEVEESLRHSIDLARAEGVEVDGE